MVEITLSSDKNLNINNFTLNSFLTKVNVIKSIHSKYIIITTKLSN